MAFPFYLDYAPFLENGIWFFFKFSSCFPWFHFFASSAKGLVFSSVRSPIPFATFRLLHIRPIRFRLLPGTLPLHSNLWMKPFRNSTKNGSCSNIGIYFLLFCRTASEKGAMTSFHPLRRASWLGNRTFLCNMLETWARGPWNGLHDFFRMKPRCCTTISRGWSIHSRTIRRASIYRIVG